MNNSIHRYAWNYFLDDQEQVWREAAEAGTEAANLTKALCKILCQNLFVIIQSMHELDVTPEFSPDAAVVAVRVMW